MPDDRIVQEAADTAAKKRRGGVDLIVAVRSALRGKDIPKGSWAEYFSAVVSELGRRGREMQPPKTPTMEAKVEAVPSKQEKQLGFGFGEGPRHKIRPPTRRHL